MLWNYLPPKSAMRTRRMTRQALRWLVVTAATLPLGTAGAKAELVQGPFGPNGTWNVYEVVAQEATWLQARDDAENREFAQIAGQLLETQTAVENVFAELVLFDYAAAHQADFNEETGVPFWFGSWLGLTDREGAAPLVNNNGIMAPQESSLLPNRQIDGWAWVSGAPVTQTNWFYRPVNTEPRDFRQAEDATVLRYFDGKWDDLPSGYQENEPMIPVLNAGTSKDESGTTTRSYLVEYPLQSATPLPNISQVTIPNRMPSVIAEMPKGSTNIVVVSIPLDLPKLGKNDGAFNLNVLSRTLDQLGADALLAMGGTDSAPQANWAWRAPGQTDPPAGGPVLSASPYRLPADQPNDLLTVGQGTFLVPESGTYTFRVTNSDEFIMRIPDSPLQSVRGPATIDARDNTQVYGTATGTSDSLVTVYLTAGSHDLQFLHLNRTSRPYWEITTAMGDVLEPDEATWLALGDSSQVGEVTLVPVARMLGAAQVISVDASSALNYTHDIRVARDILEHPDRSFPVYSRDDVTTLILHDGDGICCHRPGQYVDPAETFVLPINDPASGGSPVDADHFYSAVYGQLLIDDGDDQLGELLEMTFAMFGQNELQLHIDGVDFYDSLVDGGTDYDVDGDVALTAYSVIRPQDGAQIQGLVKLREGVIYDFDIVNSDARGDAGIEVWTALGDLRNQFDARLFFPLSSTLTRRLLPTNRGLAFVGSQPGDYDRDGQLDVEDLEVQRQNWGSSDPELDLNGDQTVDIQDRLVWLHDMKHTWMGDSNLDGAFDSRDLVDAFTAGKYELAEPATWAQGDWNGDGRFGTTDLVAAWQDGGYELGQRAAVVPEPATGAIGLAVLVAFALHCRR